MSPFSSCSIIMISFTQISMNVKKIVTTALSCATTLLVATSATVMMVTHWTLMNTLAMVNNRSLVTYY